MFKVCTIINLLLIPSGTSICKSSIFCALLLSFNRSWWQLALFIQVYQTCGKPWSAVSPIARLGCLQGIWCQYATNTLGKWKQKDASLLYPFKRQYESLLLNSKLNSWMCCFSIGSKIWFKKKRYRKISYSRISREKSHFFQIFISDHASFPFPLMFFIFFK